MRKRCAKHSGQMQDAHGLKQMDETTEYGKRVQNELRVEEGRPVERS